MERTSMTDLAQLFEDLVRAETRLYNAIDARLRDRHGLALGQYELLQIMSRREGCRVLDIVHEVGITVGAASKAVDRLEAAGWCRRRVNEQDRRSSLLAVTPAGARLIAAARPTFEAALAERLDGIAAGRTLDQTARVLAALRQRLEREQLGD
jgi:DNA-binding MarR family transcriptional regulator